AADAAIHPLDLVLQGPGGELMLAGCVLSPPVRAAGPASTLEYRVSHPGEVPEQLALWPKVALRALAHEDVGREVADRAHAAQREGEVELGEQRAQHVAHAGLAPEGQAPDVGAPDEDRA